ncbi:MULTISPECIES: hypothetical protein [Streptomyces]|uniref:hypothetical protein n=1 Tax=Streptomyces lycopersici TaxID=2974589 RepID=UPI0021D2ACA8|nr:hypothetical protein [Streptomyces sp. NEAU-383]
MFFFDTVTRVRAGTRTDRGGNTVPDWTTATRAPVDQLNIQPTGAAPGASSEIQTPERDAVISGWRVQSEPGTWPDITAMDRIEWNGMTLEVDGEVGRWSDPLNGSPHHIEFTMKRATG